jgi:ribosomal protein S18 acetylase RimI-like enzyme
MSALAVRTATLADLEALAPLFDAYRQFYEMPADFPLAKHYLGERLTRNESVILLALLSATTTPPVQDPTLASFASTASATQDLVGFCQLYPTFCSVEAKPTYTLYDLYVAPEARRLGAAQALMLVAEELALRDGKARLDLSTAKSNHGAQRLYESLGWVRDEVFFTYSKRPLR